MTEYHPYNWRLILAWISATTMPLIVGFTIAPLIDSQEVPLTGFAWSFALAFVAQWLVLRHYVRQVHLWPLLSIVGFVFGTLGSAVVGVRLGPQLAWQLVQSFFFGSCIGMIVGVAQWIILRRITVAAVGWIVVSLLAWGVAFTIVQVDLLAHWFSPLGLGAVGALVGVTYSIPTGIALSWLIFMHDDPNILFEAF
jgi:hypothetical protein